MKWVCGVCLSTTIRLLTDADVDVVVTRPARGAEERCNVCGFEGRIYGVKVVA